MKAITLWQPWAMLIALGIKRYETRSWATPYKGDLLIHSAKKRDGEVLADLRDPDVKRALSTKIWPWGTSLHFGYALCVVTLVGCIPTEKIPVEERLLGNYGPRRYAWKLENVRRLPVPIPCLGSQGLWEWTLPLPEEVKG